MLGKKVSEMSGMGSDRGSVIGLTFDSSVFCFLIVTLNLISKFNLVFYTFVFVLHQILVPR